MVTGLQDPTPQFQGTRFLDDDEWHLEMHQPWRRFDGLGHPRANVQVAWLTA